MEDRKNIRMYNKLVSLCIVFLLIFTLLQATIVLGDEPSNLVYVSPSSQVVSPQESFDISIYCEPDQPIKSFEFKLSFDSSLIEANSVTEGDIFNGYSTYFNSGVINNTAGTIINVYGLILGEGNVTDPGTLVTISFTSKSVIGTSDVSLYDVGITNETDYISILISDGIIVVEYPYISHLISQELPANNSDDVSVKTLSLSVSIKNPEGETFYWEITTQPDIGNSYGNNDTNGTKTCEISDLGYGTTYNWYVKCKDLTNGIWTNRSYLFLTEEETISLPSGGGGGGGGIIPPVAEEGDLNNAPEIPLTPTGPVYIEKDITYTYSSSSYDKDENKIRYKFDWGDGSFSEWSEFLGSNTSVSMTHYWNEISSYEIKVICQDENGENSSWSESLNVIVSQSNYSEVPVAEINVMEDDLLSNKNIVFDASESFDIDGVIINYTWDFGDGNTGYGINIDHIYDTPGEYTVTLTVVDNKGNTYSSTRTITIDAQTKKSNIEESSNIQIFSKDFQILVIPLLISIVVLLIIVIAFKEKIGLRFLNNKIDKIKIEEKINQNKKIKNF